MGTGDTRKSPVSSATAGRAGSKRRKNGQMATPTGLATSHQRLWEQSRRGHRFSFSTRLVNLQLEDLG